MKLHLSREYKVNGKVKYKSLPILKVKKFFNSYWVKTKTYEVKNEQRRV